MLLVPFRSKFVPLEAIDEGRDEPHTYVQDDNIAAKIESWRSAFVDIMRDFYDNTNAALKNLPQSMTDLKSVLKVDNNPIGGWLKGRFEVTHNPDDRFALSRDFLASLYSAYQSKRRTYTVSDEDAFKLLVDAFLRANQVKIVEKTNIKENGTFKSARNVAVGVKVHFE
jgi:hypothetical protein